MSAEDDFASAAAAAANQADAGSGEGGAPLDEGGNEPAGDDPIALLSKQLAGAGVTPEKAREAMQSIAYLQTPQGHQEYIESFVRSEQGKALRDRFGQEVLAEHLARPGGPAQIVAMLKDWGVPFPTAEPARNQEQEDESPQDREVRAMREQQRALEAKIQRMEQGSTRELQEVRGKLQGMEENSRRLEEFTAWSKTVPPMGAPAYAAVAKRAQQLSALNPNAYGGPGGFRRAAGDAAAELQNAATLFSPKQRARSLRSEGGGVAPATQDVLKKIAPKGELDLNALRASYDLVADDFARAARDGSE